MYETLDVESIARVADRHGHVVVLQADIDRHVASGTVHERIADGLVERQEEILPN